MTGGQEIHDAYENYKASVDILMQSRRILVRELVSVFRLRRVQRVAPNLVPTAAVAGQRPTPKDLKVESSSSVDSQPSGSLTDKYRKMGGASPNYEVARKLFYDDPQEYRVVNVGFCVYGDYLCIYSVLKPDINPMIAYPREKFNAGMGYVVQLTILMTHYLGVGVPFELTVKGSKSAAKGIPDRLPRIEGYSSGEMPLYLTDTNIEAFIVGISMLNFNIAYLCHTQGVTIPISNISNTLENLALCCRATKLGQDIHTPHFQSTQWKPENRLADDSTENSTFGYDFSRVLRLHTALRRRMRPNFRNRHSEQPPPDDGDSDYQPASGKGAIDPGIWLLKAVLDEESGDEEDGSNVEADWHLVSF
ncbi:hypothetical protein HDU97_009388 [Phlyctochytrium planicorne]|nr:hypothetical protein HDU97_009388 [Phlyctochytrium planicorne]